MTKTGRLPRAEFQTRGYAIIKTPFFSLKHKKNNMSHPRIGVVVGKSVHKTAVRRNFWKRQARAVAGAAIAGGVDVILVLQPSVNSSTKKQFRDVLKKAAAHLL